MKADMLFVLSYMKKRYWLLLGYIAIFFESFTPIIATLLQRDLIDRVFSQKQYQEFPKIITLYAIFFFGPKLWFTVRKVAFYHIGYHLQMNLTEKFLSKIYNMPTVLFNKEHVGSLLNHIRNNIADASDLAINQILSESVKNIFMILLLAFSIANINLIMLVIVVIVILIYYGLLRIFGHRTKLLSQQVKEKKANIAVTVEENISSIREVIAYNRQEWQIKHYDKKFSEYYTAIIAQGLYKNKILFVSAPFLYGTKLIAILIGGISVISNKISLGEFVVSFTFVDQFVTELGQLFEQGLTFKRLQASVSCIRSIMENEDNRFGTDEISETIDSIAFKNVSFQYVEDSDPILHNINVDLPIGKKIAIVGTSGSGKSTIAQLLLRLYSPNKGEILINGKNIRSYGKQYFDKIAIVFQQPHFIPSTIRENLTFEREYDQEVIENVCKDMHCHSFISEFKNQYDTLVGERGTTLSGGQKQRIALARALLRNPEVLVLDEATSALDMETEFRVQENLDKLRMGKTTIIIAHRLSTIQNADIILVLEKGKIVANGTHNSLLEECSVYRELHNVQKEKSIELIGS